jgi:glycosyltransferase involved in cell wall biosynthesis
LRGFLKYWSKSTEDEFVIYTPNLRNEHENNDSLLDKFDTVQISDRTPLGFYRKLAKRSVADHLDTIFFTLDLALFQTIPYTLLLHDLTFKKYGHGSIRNALFSFLVDRSVKNAKSIIVPSNNTREDVIAQYHKEAVYTLHLDADPAFTKLPYETVKDTLPSLIDEVGEGFLLHVGRIHSDYKNMNRLLKAFVQGKKNRTIREKLLIVSSDKPRREDARIIENNKKDILTLHKLTDSNLAILYNACNYFVYPSLYEGFGMPILEAMRCGAPVAVSRSSSLPEVAGDAGLYFNPNDTTDIFKVMSELSNNESLRKSLSKKSLERSKIFSWEIFSNESLKVIKSGAMT